MKCVCNRHLTSILTASEAAPFLFCTNQPWRVLLQGDKLINGAQLLPVTGTRTPCTSDNILRMHYISFQITLFLQMRNADRGMLGNSEQRVMKTRSKTRMKKSWLIFHGVHSYFQRGLDAHLCQDEGILTLRMENKISGTPNTTIWYSVSDTHF